METTSHICVCDDEAAIADLVGKLLADEGYRPSVCYSAAQVLDLMTRDRFDLVILDVGLPDTDGMTLTRRLRASGFTAPILMLTARDTIDDRVEGLTSGADDYLIKPFSLRELAARVEALLRRSGANPAGHLTAGPLSLDLKTLRVEREGRDIRLNPTCLQLLRELMQQSPGIVSRRRLEAVLWQGEPPASDSLRSNLYLLRQAVDKPFDHPLIHTHPGLGWSVADLPDSVS